MNMLKNTLLTKNLWVGLFFGKLLWNSHRNINYFGGNIFLSCFFSKLYCSWECCNVVWIVSYCMKIQCHNDTLHSVQLQNVDCTFLNCMMLHCTWILQNYTAHEYCMMLPAHKYCMMLHFTLILHDVTLHTNTAWCYTAHYTTTSKISY